MEPPLEERFVVDHSRFLRRLVSGVVGGADGVDDAVQETWLAAIERPPPARFRLPAWLASVARRIAGRMARSAARRARREGLAARTEVTPPPSALDIAARAERLRVVTDAVVGLDEPYRSAVIGHFYEGLSAEELARRDATPLATVRSRLQRAKALLRQRLEARLGRDLRAQLGWITAWRDMPRFVEPATPASAAATGSAAAVGAATAIGMATTGATVVTMGAKVGAAAVVAIVAGAAWWLARDPVITPTRVDRVAREERPLEEPAASEGAPAVEAERVAQPSESAPVEPSRDPAFASLRLRVVWERDGTPAADRSVRLFQFGAPPAQRSVRRRSDERGELVVDRVHPGTVMVEADLGGYVSINAKAGDHFEETLTIPRSYGVRVRVVDEAGAPAAGASLWCSDFFNYHDGVVVATSDVDGRFEFPSFPGARYLGAILPGHAPSPLAYVEGLRGRLHQARVRDGTTGPDVVDVELTIGGEGAALHGVVFAPDGRPAAGVVVRAAARWWGNATKEEDEALGHPSLMVAPHETTSDATGRFVFAGLQPSDVELVARRDGCAPWGETVTLAAGDDLAVEARFRVEGIVEGRVVDEAGEPVADASVRLAGEYDPQEPSTKSASDGSFRLVGLPIDAVTITAKHDAAGEGSASPSLRPGVIGRCELVVAAGLVLRGRVVDETGAPAVGLLVQVHDSSRRFWRQATTAADGRFRITACIDSPLFLEVVRDQNFASPELQVPDVLAGGEEQEFVLGRVASIRLMVVASDGRPAIAWLVPWLEGQSSSRNVASDPATGVIEARGLAPGDYRLTLRSDDQREWPLGHHRLEARQHLDLGTIALQPPGRLRLRVDGAAGDGAFDRVTLHRLPADGKGLGDSVEAPSGIGWLDTVELVPGDYRLSAIGAGVAAASRRFRIDSDQETVVELATATGVACRVAIDLPEGAGELLGWKAWIEGDDFAVPLRLPSGWRDSAKLADFIVLLPSGRYRFVVELDRRLSGSATVDVAEGTEPRASIVVR